MEKSYALSVIMPWIMWLHTAAAWVWYWDKTQALCVKVCQLLAIGRWFAPGAQFATPVKYFIIVNLPPPPS